MARAKFICPTDEERWLVLNGWCDIARARSHEETKRRLQGGWYLHGNGPDLVRRQATAGFVTRHCSLTSACLGIGFSLMNTDETQFSFTRVSAKTEMPIGLARPNVGRVAGPADRTMDGN